MDRKEEILAAASRVFQKYGLVKSTLGDIARECGFKKTALYYYFKNKDEIFQTMFHIDIEKMKSSILVKVSKPDSPIEKLRIYLFEKVKSLNQMEKYFDLFMREDAPKNYRDFAIEQKEKILKEEMEFLSEIINGGIEQKIFKKISAFSLIHILLGTAYGLSLESFFFQRNHNTGAEIDNILEIILNGIKK